VSASRLGRPLAGEAYVELTGYAPTVGPAGSFVPPIPPTTP
jgi:hypothetical protein